MKTLAMLACLALIPIYAGATSTVPVNGSGFWNAAVTAGFGGTFGPYFLSSSLPSGASQVAFCPTQGATCNVVALLQAVGPGFSDVTENGVDVGIFTGNLYVATSFLAPSGPEGSSISITAAPATISGNVEIFAGPNEFGGILANYSISGTGPVDFSGTVVGGADLFSNGDVTFTGQGTVLPEPGSLTLLGLGVVGLALAFRFLRP